MKKIEKIVRKYFSDEEAEIKGYVERADMREIFGSKSMQELKFK